MKLVPMLIGLSLLAGAARAQNVPAYSGDGAIRRAETAAKAASFTCEAELKAGPKAPACEQYHSAVIRALTLQAHRQTWCQSQSGGEDSLLRLPDSCLGNAQADLRLGEVETLERKRSPAAWRKFDQAMGKIQ